MPRICGRYRCSPPTKRARTSRAGSKSVKWLRSTARIGCRTARRYASGRPANSRSRPRPMLLRLPIGAAEAVAVVAVVPTDREIPKAGGNMEDAAAVVKGRSRSESIPALHSQAGSYVPHDGGRRPGRRSRLLSITGVGLAAVRLSDHPGADLLPGRKSGGDDFVSYGAARKAVRTGAGADSDDLRQLVRHVGGH